MEYKFKEYERIMDTPNKKLEEKAIAEKKAMEEKAREYGLGNIQSMSYSTFLNIAHKIGKERIVIDEVEGLLNRLSPNIEGYTLGLEE